VYLHSHLSYNGYVMRMTRDGKNKSGGDSGYATGNVAANANGIMAAVNQHFTHSVGFYDKDLVRFAGVDEFVSWTKEFGEASSYSDPFRVEVGVACAYTNLERERRETNSLVQLRCYTFPVARCPHAGVL